MKYNLKYFFIVLLLVSAFACKKQEALYFANGNAAILKSSVTTITPQPSDSNNVVLTLTWSNPKYATDSAHQKFIIDMDSSGRNFSHKVSFEVDGPLSYSFTGSKLDNLLANFGFTAGKSFNVDIRVTSSYSNNNEQYQSNVVTVAMTPYLIPITLTASTAGPLTLQINNATSTAVSFKWNASPYGNSTINYALQLDTVGGNFKNPQVFKYGTSLNASIIQNDLNIAIINSGVLGGATKTVEFRIVSYQGTSYSNPLVYSNVDSIKISTYVPVPANLYIIGDATPEVPQWSNSAALAPAQQFTKIDAVSFGIIINLTAGKGYVFLPVDNGDWTHKYGGATDGTAAGGSTLLADGLVPGSNTPAPATSGLYKIVVNFQTNTYTVTPVTVPANLYIIGDATPETPQWTNSTALAPSQQFTKINPGVFGVILNLTAGKGYVFLPVDNGDWTHKYGGTTDGTATGGGTLLVDNAVPGSNTPAPATTGVYMVIVNFVTNTYTVTPYTGPTLPANITPNPNTLATGLWIIGDATPENPSWTNTPSGLASQQFTQLSNADYQITIALTTGKSYVFVPAAGDWGNKYGGTTDGTQPGGGTLLFDNAVPGSNTPAPTVSGNYLIDVNFLTGLYTVTKQ
jgi:starch-binding outer membrane protein SusE/F